MKVLLIFYREDPYIVTLRNAIIKCGYFFKCCRNIEEIHEAFKKVNYDLVFIDSRRSVSNPKLKDTLLSTSNNTQINTLYEPENICQFIRKLFQQTVIVALTQNYDDRDVPNVLPLLKIGFNKTFAETTNLNRCINELVTLEYGEVSNVKRLQAAHVLFTALEYSGDSIEILNSQFNVLYVNNAFEKLTGTSMNEVCGQNFNSIHQLDESANELLANLRQGNVCKTQMPYYNKSSGECGNYSCYSIPVIVQGETNRINNYVNIAHVNTTSSSPDGDSLIKAKHLVTARQMSNNETAQQNGNSTFCPQPQKRTNSNATINKKLSGDSVSEVPVPTNPSENLFVKKLSISSSKRSYDFGKFAQLYGLENQSKDSLRKTLSNSYSAQVLANLHPSVSNTSSSSPYNEDSSDSFNILNSLTRSFPEFIHQDTNDVSNLIQRKHSYDVKNSQKSFNETQRRHSTTRVLNHQSIKTPIRNVIYLISEAHNQSKGGAVKESLAKALNILRSNELYNPSSYLENDIQTNALVNGLMTSSAKANLIKKDQLNQHLSQSHNIMHKNNTKSLINGKTPMFSSHQNTTSHIKNSSPEIIEILDTSGSWNFDIISLERLTEKRPLVTLGMNIMERFGVCAFLKIDEQTLVNWLTMIELNYKAKNPYHNSTHASDVLHATAYFLSNSKISDILDNCDKVASLLAAAAHDLNHPGRTNAFLMNSNNELALLYNDQAVLENHHSALAFQLTRAHQHANIFKNLSSEEYRQIRSVVIDMILATEMNKHFEHLNKFVNKFFNSQENAQLEFYKKIENRVLIKRILIKCADVSNPARPLDIYKEWANRIAEEYFEQTDEEERQGLTVVMPTFNRKSCNIPKSQISFIEYFVTEMFEAWDEFTYIPEVIANLQANLLYWKECVDTQDLNQMQIANNNNSNNKNISNDGNTKINRLILEDIESEISDDSK